MLALPAATTALILVDLQQGIVSMPALAPRPGAQVAVTGGRLAARFRTAGAPVVLVNVAFAADFGDVLKQPVDRSFSRPEGGFPANFSQLVEKLAHASDILVTKHQWGAFYGTDLDVQLRRRNVKTVVLAGIATNMGVESTARQAYEHGYDVVIAEDATTGLSHDMHAFAVDNIFPLLARVVKSDDIDLKY
ncbi:isochorismatase [Caballeronia udeis]|uniref:Isochorismatase n=1 Tax=Caballeronia udeis TaxID=1232866 RepID=A0A158F2F8_9BURK|nr:hydrolase [Caballeronia udeis]SAL13569.1 isochorismatase [Caballeronia udeis]